MDFVDYEMYIKVYENKCMGSAINKVRFNSISNNNLWNRNYTTYHV